MVLGNGMYGILFILNVIYGFNIVTCYVDKNGKEFFIFKCLFNSS